MKTYNYTIYRPGGNDTALVQGMVSDSIVRKQINDAILKQNPNVEQVGFIEKQNNQYLFEMAGNEFSGNGLRTAAFAFLNEKPGKILINMPSINKTLEAGVDFNKNTWAQIPIYQNTKYIYKQNGYFIVDMNGTKNIIIKRQTKFRTKQQAKNKAKEILKKYNFWQKKGVAVLFIYKKKKQICLEPVYWIKNMNTLTYETACGSGSTAIALFEAAKQKQSVNLAITQPSGSQLNVAVDYSNNKFKKAILSGPIKKLRTKTVKI